MRQTKWIRKIKTFIVALPVALLPACDGESEKHTVSDEEPVIFNRIPSAQSGITFTNTVPENRRNYFDEFAYVYNGGGVGIGDFNNDDLPDLFFTGNEVPNRLYLNTGNLTFRDITESAGVQGNGRWNNGVTLVDINNDGWLDIYVCKGGWQESEEQRKNLLFVNQGDLTFREQARDYGLDESGHSIHAVFFDLENDNDLDVYITNRPDSFDLPLTQMVRQKKLSPTKSRDKLYVNENGTFSERGLQAGITNNFGYALSVVASDLNQDGFTDIFVANDFAESDYLYINQGNGTFREKIREATNHISMYSMGTDIADINNDGLEDIMVSEMLPEDYKRSKVSMPSMDVEGFYTLVNSGMHRQYMHNALHLNQGNLFFSEISQLSGVAKTEWSWSCLLSDFNNDGLRDIFVANGYKRDVFDGDVQQKITHFIRSNKNQYGSPEEMLEKGFQDFINLYEPIKVTNYLFKNTGDLKFEKVSNAWGFNEAGFSNGAAVGDLDNDGDLDLVVNNIDEEAYLYENTASGQARYLKIELKGPSGNRDGIGAKVTLFRNGQVQFFENKTVRGYLSSNDPVVHFGVGTETEIDSISILWPDGRSNTIRKINTNQTIAVDHSQSSPKQEKKRKPNEVLFTEMQFVSSLFVHRENTVNEYKDQVLLPHMFSRSGPFLSTGDVNNDGLQDFFIGGASGQAGQLFIQNGNTFVKKETPALDRDKAFEDMGSLFFDADGDGDNDLYVVSGGSEFPQGSDQYNDRLYRNDGKGNFSERILLPTLSSGSCVAAYDADGDGDMDLFRGGQVIAGTYPKIPTSYWLMNDGGRFTDKTSSFAPILERAGMVNSAVWADLNNDQKAELIVAGEWMPIRIFSNTGQRMEEVTDAYGLQQTEGWWNKLVADDIDNDGDIDLIAGNIGENYKFKASPDKPFQVFAKDFDANGTNDIFLARYYNDTLLVPIRGRECSSQQMPGIARQFPTYSAFAGADLSGILGADLENALHYKAHLFSSVILRNENGKFQIEKLPVEAQLSAVTGILVEDVNGDQKKDLVLAGNKFDVEVETTAADASPGVILTAGNDGGFKALKPGESGFFVPYNVKDIKILKRGETWIILVAVNNDALRVFQIKPGKPGQIALN